MMNKKLLICGAIATGLLLTACVKKEAPKEDEQEQTLEHIEQQPQETVEITTIDTSENDGIPTYIEIEHEESNNTSATIRREPRDVVIIQAEPTNIATPTPRVETIDNQPKAEVAKPKAEVKALDSKAEVAKPKASNTTPQSEDDAVAAAIAAAMPALDK